VPEVGDQVQVVGTKVEQAPRSGVVTDVRGRMITVQWATGNQTVFVPAPGTLTVLGRADVRRPGMNVGATAARSARGAISARRSTTTKKAARKTAVRKTKKGAAKKAARNTAIRKTKKGAAKKAARNTAIRKTKKGAAKKAARKGAVRKTAKKRVAKKAARKRVR
jgi:hypothetical protein